MKYDEEKKGLFCFLKVIRKSNSVWVFILCIMIFYFGLIVVRVLFLYINSLGDIYLFCYKKKFV